ncbi:uncharacterized protein LOC127879991 isoform X2 [Dreissena polymorpha]|uniref:Uncharacterized protein n=2 Tax=Dreissena polymorpha TaxID=45954 RepID=A0A9D4QLD2_DREPO|nr:uncharacterized protein LOC127879991 isoform X2 [Dreissena polymorpha]XP_052283124.1 uncharacterized protein LOC127879991 isoform X2 [Dreissena polymorpha]XP_052283125.1 uncharacterized protein LOC127879991 isoform X2 [Dreissena polymorpha]XP_052283126.1 uncharacterized protein LOC127879991 isoform X2 [Dreissena polymorpha]KAH3835471.1 hypothetical protein DPMN_108819 [Dreissena polymorpha]
MKMFRAALCVVILASVVYCMPTEIDAKAKCGSSFNLTLNEDYRVATKAVVDTNYTCMVKFTSETKGDCKGTCYMFDKYAEISDDKVTLNVGNMTYQKGSDFPHEPRCIDDVTVDVTLIHVAGFMYNKTDPNYKFKLDVYNKCGPKGKVKSMTFEEAVEEVDGYHHGEEKTTREKSELVSGVLIGFGLTSMFLVTFGIVQCYSRFCRSRNKLPKHGAQQNITPEQQPVQVENGVQFKSNGSSGQNRY